MSDRELLELAAKAAGILPLPDGKELDAAPDGGLMICGGGEVKYWNPRDDDGDALRLAVKTLDSDQIEAIWAEVNAMRHKSFADEVAATRRAIFHAAAEVGRNMP